MLKKSIKIIILISLVLTFFLLKDNLAKALVSTSDKISSSWPGVPTDHIITFTTTKEIPPSGKIVVTPQAGMFTIITGFGYNEIDLAVSTSSNGVFIDREVGAIPDLMFDGVSIPGVDPNRRIEITLNSSTGIPAGSSVRITLGLSASYGAPGEYQILNPSDVGSYEMAVMTHDASNNYLERARPKIYIIEPVNAGSKMIKTMSYPTPSGALESGTVSTILSFFSNFRGNCRYATATDTPYNSMTNTFEVNGDYFHSSLLTALMPGQRYHFFIRCRDTNGISDDPTMNIYTASTTPYYTEEKIPILIVTQPDFYITFYVNGQNESSGGGGGTNTGNGGSGSNNGGGSSGGNGSSGGGGGGGGSGGSGGGSGKGTGSDRGRGTGDYLPYPPLPGAPGVVITGWAFGGKEVTILMDGQIKGYALAQTNGTFGAFLEDLTQGNFTFGITATDSQKRQATMHSSTFYIRAGTQNTLSGIIISPTFSLMKENIPSGEKINLSGEAVPSTKVIIELYPAKSKVTDSEIIKTETLASNQGLWTAEVDSSKLTNGVYKIKARSYMEKVGFGDYSYIKDLQIGPAQEKTGLCKGADLNKDSKVNITDFSILLYYWGTNNSCADQNKDGTVNITDFSIMMYYWTG
jgi:hypothetical protein